MKKRMLCLFLVILLMAQIMAEAPRTAYASEVTAPENTGGTVVEEQKKESKESSLPTGQIDVSLEPALILAQPVTFAVSLAGQGEKTITLAADGEAQTGETAVSFPGLVPGDYVLKVAAPGFADYTQTVTVDRQGVSLRLMTGFVQGITYEEEACHPGVLLMGDVTGDGIIDGVDASGLVDAVDAADGGSGNEMDLNGDGKVDLVDLQYLAEGYQTGRYTATPRRFIPSAVITAVAGAGTAAEGDLDSLTAGTGSVKLTPQNNKAISQDNPVSVELAIGEAGDANLADGIIIETKDDTVSKAVIDLTYTDTDGSTQSVSVPVEAQVSHLLKNSDIRAEFDARGRIQIHLGSQIAVKKVTLTIVGMKKNNNLAEISRVEFVNGMEQRIPEPEMDIPRNLAAEAGSGEFTLSWDSCVNVTGYEVLVSLGEQSETRRVTGNALQVTTFGGKGLVNRTEYTVRVQSVNGTWRSGYGEAVTVVPKADKRPDRPDNVSARGQYRGITVSWKKAKDAVSYHLYYKEKQESTYRKIENILTTSYTITGLKDHTEYTVYVTAVNELGESDPSLTSAAKTTDIEPAAMPQYGLINYGEQGEKGAGIVSAVTGRKGAMHDSPLDPEQGTVWGTVDKNPKSYYLVDTWDDGGYNAMDLSHGLTYEFDQTYTIQRIALQELVPDGNQYFYARVRYWTESGYETVRASVTRKYDADERPYYLLTLPQKVTTGKLQIGLARYATGAPVSVSEVYFYHYDTLQDEIMALYVDDLHLELKPEVTQSTIDELRVRINMPDERSNEYHPERELLERELKNAEDILNNNTLNQTVEIYNTISTNDVNRGFGGLNAWQPIGISAAAGETVTIYVGHNTKKTGENTNLQLVATQYHSESSPMYQLVATLKVGVNVIDIPKLWTTDAESGGALYIQYTGKDANDRYAVRTSGGVAVPRLDLYHVTDPAGRLERAAAYVEELRAYTARMEELHQEFHEASDHPAVGYAYNERNCILGATDILLDDMMLSLPAGQVLRGCGSGTVQQQAEQMVRSLDAMEDMMDLFYQHKGLNDDAPSERDRKPKQHLNIRYQRMFSGAFMYAAGVHIGIEWNETAGMLGADPIVADSAGRYQSGRYFGWGISHEIGHCINQGAYAIAEVTNNYFAQLAQAKDSNDSVRFKYDRIYEKVTSGTTGNASNVFTQLGMYWQLHLAYDDSYNFKTYDTYKEQLDGIFFARVDTYARDTARAPAPGGVALRLCGDREQDLMRLCCAAAQKNILSFFQSWGKTPNEDTIAYAGQFEEETRAICYVSDDARRYRLEHTGSTLGTSGQVEAVGEDTTASIAAGNASQVDFVLTSRNIPREEVLGFEIVRCTISGGETQREVVGFATGNTFSDRITTMNNRVVSYEVTLVDQYLNRSKTVALEPLKIEHNGSLDKTLWTIGATGLTARNQPDAGSGDDNTPCAPEAEDPLEQIIDGDAATVYAAFAEASAEILIDFHKDQVISGFQYTAGDSQHIRDYIFYVKDDNGKWRDVSRGILSQSETFYFENPEKKYVSTYRTDAVKLVLTGADGDSVSIGELDVLGVTGDNIDFNRIGDGTAAIGILEEAFVYGDSPQDVIPAGSVVFTGVYKGNPAYNVVMLYDQDGNLVGGVDASGNLAANQIILADVPDDGVIQNVSEGTWIYWIQPEDRADLAGIQKVRAELYRVNQAQTNEGQRLVSDSLFQEMPETLPGITFTGNDAGGQ